MQGNRKKLLDPVKRAYILSRRIKLDAMYALCCTSDLFMCWCSFTLCIFIFILLLFVCLYCLYRIRLRSFRSAFFNGILTRFHQQLHGIAYHVNIMQCNKIVSSYTLWTSTHNIKHNIYSTCTKIQYRNRSRVKKETKDSAGRKTITNARMKTQKIE